MHVLSIIRRIDRIAFSMAKPWGDLILRIIELEYGSALFVPIIDLGQDSLGHLVGQVLISILIEAGDDEVIEIQPRSTAPHVG